MEIPVRPIKNEDGTYTVKFPEDMVVEDESVAIYLQMLVTEFAIRFYTGGPISYKDFPHNPRKKETEKGGE